MSKITSLHRENAFPRPLRLLQSWWNPWARLCCSVSISYHPGGANFPGSTMPGCTMLGEMMKVTLLLPILLAGVMVDQADARERVAREQEVIDGGLDWLANTQSRLGHWSANGGNYPTAMTALAGIALLSEGSTTTQGKYAPNIRAAVDYLLSDSRALSNGLIGDPVNDDRYTYGHGFAMLFLSQVLGEEEDELRRRDLMNTLAHAVVFTGRAQTKAGGWGYKSAKEDNDFDEGSTTVTQVQGLRACRNAGVPVPREIIDKAVDYIHRCTTSEGGVRYQLRSSGDRGRPAITAAAVACLFNAGEYGDKNVPKMLEFCQKNLSSINEQGFGHWHYAHYYYAQVLYRQGGTKWSEYSKKIKSKIIEEARRDGDFHYWDQGYIGSVYTTAMNLTILQLDNAALPIYQQ